MTASLPSPSPSDRLHYMDAVRAFALTLGVIFHASISFNPTIFGWAVTDVSTGPAAGVLFTVSHSFRMALFFLIAGFFGHMTYHRKGIRTFLASRGLRLALPFVVFWFLLRPFLISGFDFGWASMRGESDLRASLTAGFATFNELPQGLFVQSHLWFLYYLMLITLIVTAGRTLLSLSGLYSVLTTWADAATHWLATSRFMIPVLAVPAALALWHMQVWGMETPDKSLVPVLPVLAIYGTAFGLGWILHRQPHLVAELSRITFTRAVVAVASAAAAILLSGIQYDPSHPQYALARAGFCAVYGFMIVSFLFLTLGLFRRFIRQAQPGVRYLADSSYWMYLIHLPIVIWLQILVAELPLHWSLKLVAISLATIAFCLLTYDLLVRPTLVGRVLNGRIRPSMLYEALTAMTTRSDEKQAKGRYVQVSPPA